MKRLVVGAALAAALSLPGIAQADDFVAVCVASSGGLPNAEQMCQCTSEKVSGADRAGAVKVMKATAEALQGKAVDQKVLADNQQSMLVLANAQAACLK